MYTLLLQAAAGQGGSPWMTWIMLALIIVVFYFFMIRPQMKRQKALRQFQDNLSKGDRVLVSGGIFGTVYEVKPTSIIVEIDHDVRIQVLKSAVYSEAGETTSTGNQNR